MATITSTITLTDRMTSPLMRITQALTSTLDAMESMKGSMDKGFDVSKIDFARKSIESANAAIMDLGNDIDNNTASQRGFNNAIDSGVSSVNRLVGAFAGLVGFKKMIGLSDKDVQIRARLDLMTDGKGTKKLENKIFASAQRARANYLTQADIVSKLGQRAPQAFNSNDETILFSENLIKLFNVAGASNQEIASASLQLTQALGSGVLRGEELNAVFEAAPNIIKTIADYMGKPIGEIRNLASEGQITANIVKNALLGATNDINEKFDKMPMTWGQVWTRVCNDVYRASRPLLSFINMLANNWSVLEPTVMGLATAVGIYTGALLINNTVTKISAMIDTVAAARKMLLAGETFKATVIQHGFNAALMACPLTWIVLAIIAVVVAIYTVIAAINKAKGTTVSATGVILGCLNVVLQFFWNLLKAAGNIALGIGTTFAVVGYNIYMYFNNSINNIKAKFWGLLETITQVAIKIAEVLNKLPFVNIDITGLTNKSKYFAFKKAEALSNIREYKSLQTEVTKAMNTFSAFENGWVSKAYNWGYDKGSNLLKSDNAFGGIEDILNGISKDTSSISDNMDISTEDLKYLKDLAEQEAINRYTVLNVNLEMTNNNSINSEMDVDGVISRMADKLQTSIEENLRSA